MQESKIVLKELLKEYHDQKLSHAFLLETNDEAQCLLEIIEFLKQINCVETYKDNCTNCNLCRLFDHNNMPSLKIIEPIGQNIKKEQVLELKNTFQTKPIFSKYNMYIIKDAEKLNASSANTMLKFLEEPIDNLLGFFITNNKENVIDTIKSRCQVFSCFYPLEKEKIDDEIILLAKKFILEFETKNDEAMIYVNHLLKDDNVLVNQIDFLKGMLITYQNLYESKIKGNSIEIDLDNIIKKDVNYYLKQTKILMDLLDKMQYNGNLQMALEEFILKRR